MKQWVLFIGFLLAFSFVAQAQCWDKVPFPAKYSHAPMWCMYVTDSTTIWVGSDSMILKSEDNGASWKEIFQTTWHSRFTEIEFLGKDSLWFHDRDTLWFSPDNGESFEKIAITPKSNAGIQVISDSTFWIVTDNTKKVFKSTTQGKTWEEKGDLPITNGNPEDILMLDDSIGFIIGNIFLWTQDGGTTWKDPSIEDLIFRPRFAFVKEILFNDKANGWVGGGSLNTESTIVLYKTYSKGIEWERYSIPMFSPYYEIRGIGKQEGSIWVGGINHLLKVSEDNRYRYEKIDTVFRLIQEIDFFDNNTGWALSSESGDPNLWKYNPIPIQCVDYISFTDLKDSLVAVQSGIEWKHPAGCIDGYFIKIGHSPGGEEVLASTDVYYDTVFYPSFLLPYDTLIYITISPYGDDRQATICSSFIHRTQPNPVHTFDIPDIGNVRIFPNPASDFIQVEYNLYRSEKSLIQLIDQYGKVCMEWHMHSRRSGREGQMLEISELESGFYTLRLLTEKQTVNKKLIIIDR